MSKVDLKEMIGGSIQEKFQHSFDRVMENMQDVNTPYKDKREINIKMTFVQNEARDNVVASVKVSEKLASQSELMTQFAVGKDLRSGKVIAKEYGSQLRGQLELNAEHNDRIDPETEEITDGIVDFRKVKGE